jgi:asparagine synthase (glutamine-hydrolysing)
MCGISAIAGPGWAPEDLAAMIEAQRHRGPDDTGSYLDRSASIGLGHNRLSIIDLSSAGHQPMASPDGRVWIAFNGEIYNYLELRAELSDYPFRTRTDTEVILAAYCRWGERCLDRLQGMFAFVLWDGREGTLSAVRDRFGVKPLHYAHRDGALLLASEIKALHAAGVPAEPDRTTWASYFAAGITDHGDRTFWRDVQAVPPGHLLTWDRGRVALRRWYDVADQTGRALDDRPQDVVADEYLSLLRESVRLRFRADVPVGINLSGGLDSSVLLGVVQEVQGTGSDVRAFTFVTGDPHYDELPWVRQMLARTSHPSEVCRLDASDVPALAESVQRTQDEPFGGLPTLCYARLFDRARALGVKVLLDGQGLDEQWAGYDYYTGDAALDAASTVQGTASPARLPHSGVPRRSRLSAAADTVPRSPEKPAVSRSPVHEDPARAALQRSRLDARLDRAARAVPRSPAGGAGPAPAAGAQDSRRHTQTAVAGPGAAASAGRSGRGAEAAAADAAAGMAARSASRLGIRLHRACARARRRLLVRQPARPRRMATLSRGTRRQQRVSLAVDQYRSAAGPGGAFRSFSTLDP